MMQEFNHTVDRLHRQRIAGIKAMSDVDMPCPSVVADEMGRTSRHICAEDRRRRLITHAPPRAAMLGDIGHIGLMQTRPTQESVDGAPFGRRQSAEIDRQVDDTAQGLRVLQRMGHREQIAGLCHRRQQEA